MYQNSVELNLLSGSRKLCNKIYRDKTSKSKGKLISRARSHGSNTSHVKVKITVQVLHDLTARFPQTPISSMYRVEQLFIA